MMYSDLSTKTDYLDWFDRERIKNPLAVTLTLKQRLESNTFRGKFGSKVDLIKVSENTRHFLNRLNQSVYGKGFTRYNKRLSVIPVMEGNSYIRFHIHMTLEKPNHIDQIEFEMLITECWLNTHYGYNNIKINPIHDYMGWISYKLKTKSKSDGVHSSVDVDNVSLN